MFIAQLHVYEGHGSRVTRVIATNRARCFVPQLIRRQKALLVTKTLFLRYLAIQTLASAPRHFLKPTGYRAFQASLEWLQII